MHSVALTFALIGQACFITNPANFSRSSYPIYAEPQYELKACEPVVIPDDYTVLPGYGVYKVHTSGQQWNDARQTCESEGAYLAVINSEEEAQAVAELAQAAAPDFGQITDEMGYNYTAVGWHGLYEDSTYITIHGDTLEGAGFAEWATGEPDHQGGVEHCGSLQIYEAKNNDINCWKKFAFVCELNDPHVATY